MKLAIFGATGLTGKVLVEEAAARGHTLRILARRDVDKASLPEGTEVVKGDYLDSAARKETLKGVDVALSTVGPPPTRKTDLKPEDFGNAMEQLIGELKDEGISRFINLASTGTLFPHEKYGFVQKFFAFIFNIVVPVVIPGKTLELRALSKSVDLDWTCIRPPYIKTGAGGTLNADDAKPPAQQKVDTHELARFMLDQIESKEWIKKAPFVGS